MATGAAADVAAAEAALEGLAEAGGVMDLALLASLGLAATEREITRECRQRRRERECACGSEGSLQGMCSRGSSKSKSSASGSEVALAIWCTRDKAAPAPSMSPALTLGVGVMEQSKEWSVPTTTKFCSAISLNRSFNSSDYLWHQPLG